MIQIHLYTVVNKRKRLMHLYNNRMYYFSLKIFITFHENNSKFQTKIKKKIANPNDAEDVKSTNSK